MDVIFFFNETAPTEIYTLSLHDALPISGGRAHRHPQGRLPGGVGNPAATVGHPIIAAAGGLSVVPSGRPSCVARYLRFRRRSEEHTSELQSRQYLVCRLLLEKKKTTQSL